MKKIRDDCIIGVAIMFIIFTMGGLFMYVAYDRQLKYPQYGADLIPKSEKQRKRDAEPQIYVGR
jgi:hypothetical protein